MLRKSLHLALSTACLAAFFGTGCSNQLYRDRSIKQNPVPDRNAQSVDVLTQHLDIMQQLVRSAPGEQAEIVMRVQREYDLAPTASHQLRYALVLAAPGHGATDLSRAQQLLQSLMATPEALLPVERSLAFLELQKIAAQLTLLAENRRLQTDVQRGEREKLAGLNKRLQTETDENARLRKELEAARAKLDAIANIEKSLNERKPP